MKKLYINLYEFILLTMFLGEERRPKFGVAGLHFFFDNFKDRKKAKPIWVSLFYMKETSDMLTGGF